MAIEASAIHQAQPSALGAAVARLENAHIGGTAVRDRRGLNLSKYLHSLGGAIYGRLKKDSPASTFSAAGGGSKPPSQTSQGPDAGGDGGVEGARTREDKAKRMLQLFLDRLVPQGSQISGRDTDTVLAMLKNPAGLDPGLVEQMKDYFKDPATSISTIATSMNVAQRADGELLLVVGPELRDAILDDLSPDLRVQALQALKLQHTDIENNREAYENPDTIRDELDFWFKVAQRKWDPVTGQPIAPATAGVPSGTVSLPAESGQPGVSGVQVGNVVTEGPDQGADGVAQLDAAASDSPERVEPQREESIKAVLGEITDALGSIRTGDFNRNRAVWMIAKASALPQLEISDSQADSLQAQVQEALSSVHGSSHRLTIGEVVLDDLQQAVDESDTERAKAIIGGVRVLGLDKNDSIIGLDTATLEKLKQSLNITD